MSLECFFRIAPSLRSCLWRYFFAIKGVNFDGYINNVIGNYFPDYLAQTGMIYRLKRDD